MNRPKIAGFVREKTVLVTGAGGSIGSALTRALVLLQPDHLILLDHSETSLNNIRNELSADCSRVSFELGSVTDLDFLKEVFGKYRPHGVFHAAAFKHVPLMELNPLVSVQNNAIATYALAKLCRENSVSNLVLISTDKAVNPISIMGASKRVAELALGHFESSNNRMTAIRLGNVLLTEGSVVPLFLDQIRKGGPVTVTDPHATRYFFTLEDAVDLILSTAAEDTNGIFIPKVNAPVNIHAMAVDLIAESSSEKPNDIEVRMIGLRPGDKLSEEFSYAFETTTSTTDPQLLRIASAYRSDSFEADIEALSGLVRERDVAGAIDAVRRLVPEYQPSETLMRISQELPA